MCGYTAIYCQKRNSCSVSARLQCVSLTWTPRCLKVQSIGRMYQSTVYSILFYFHLFFFYFILWHLIFCWFYFENTFTLMLLLFTTVLLYQFKYAPKGINKITFYIILSYLTLLSVSICMSLEVIHHTVKSCIKLVVSIMMAPPRCYLSYFGSTLKCMYMVFHVKSTSVTFGNLVIYVEVM